MSWSFYRARASRLRKTRRDFAATAPGMRDFADVPGKSDPHFCYAHLGEARRLRARVRISGKCAQFLLPQPQQPRCAPRSAKRGNERSTAQADRTGGGGHCALEPLRDEPRPQHVSALVRESKSETRDIAKGIRRAAAGSQST